MTTSELETVRQVWPTLAPLLFVPHSQEDYEQLVQMLDGLIDIIGEDEDHRLASLVEVLGVLIEKYEDEYVTELS